jgi:hypothetical protein
MFLLLTLFVPQSLKLLAAVSEDHSGALQLAAQVNFRLDEGQASADAYDKLKAAGQVRVTCNVCGGEAGGVLPGCIPVSPAAAAHEPYGFYCIFLYCCDLHRTALHCCVLQDPAFSRRFFLWLCRGTVWNRVFHYLL